MRRYLILSRCAATGKALQRTLAVLRPELSSEAVQGDQIPVICLDGDGHNVDQGFDYLADQFMAELGKDASTLPIGKVHVIVDEYDLTEASVLEGRGWEASISMLILAFPEVHWAFAAVRACTKDFTALLQWHSFRNIIGGLDADPLCDGSGLRNTIRTDTAEAKDSRGNKVAPYVPIRASTAAALEDEQSYAYFNAYTAYRFGFRAFPVDRNALAHVLFENERLDGDVPYLTFEDVYLSYPDKEPNQHYSDLGSTEVGSRKRSLPGLEMASYRIFVTTDHRHAGDSSKHERNRCYIRTGECVRKSNETGRYGRTVNKPFSGMFALWTTSRLAQRLRWTDKQGRRFVGTAPGFVWPPQASARTSDQGHSAPGRLLQMATHMITRCEAMLRAGVHTVPDAARCAVLATDALELLGDRTPTTAMDALKLKHMAEVTAECEFSGVEYHIEIKPRLKEIQVEARSLSRWFDRRRKVMAAMNAEMTTVIELMRIFRDHGQFDETLVCQNRVRHLHNRLWICQQPARVIFWPLLKYTEVVLASFGCFLAAIAAWLLGFVGLFTWAATLKERSDGVPEVLNGSGPWEQAFTAFTAANTFTSANFTWNLLTVCAALIGIAHIGIFISHVYMLVSRKD